MWWRKEEGSEYAIYLTHDLSMLRLIETFCESAPQLILMMYVMLSTNKARVVQCESSYHECPSNRLVKLHKHDVHSQKQPDKFGAILGIKSSWSQVSS